MISVYVALAIFLLCLIGSSYTSWKLGQQVGAEDVLIYLEESGIITIEYEDEG